METRGKLKVVFESEKQADAAEHALRIEKGMGRARVSIARDGKAVEASIQADDVVAFRAAANSVLRNMQVFESIEKDIDKKVLK